MSLQIPTPNLTNSQIVEKTFELLNEGERQIVLSEQHKNAVLLLGNTGSGKSALVQWLAGDDSKLIAKELRKGSGEFLIEDNNKRIGNATITSKTVFPELVVDPKTQTAFYDTPGFSDTRSTSFDVATSYFIKKVADHVEAVKLLFVVGYPSVRKGVDRQDFMTLLRHSTDILRNIDKFENSIALVVTKVDNQYVEMEESLLTLVEDRVIIESIADFLQEIQQSLKDRLKEPKISEKDETFYRKSIEFVKILLRQNDEKAYTRIGIFRRPNKAGPLSKISIFHQGKRHIQLIMSEYLDFTRKNADDFGYTVSDRSKNDIGQLVEKINDNVWYDLGVIVDKIHKYYDNLVEKISIKINSFTQSTQVVEANVNEAQTFRAKLDKGQNVSAYLVNKTIKGSTIKHLSNLLSKILAILNIETCENNLQSISKQGNYFDFLQVVSDTKLATRSWASLLQNLVALISNTKQQIQIDIDNNERAIGIVINSTINELVQEINQNYQKKMLSLEIQILPSILENELVALIGMRKIVNKTNTPQEFALELHQNLFKLHLETDQIKNMTSRLYYYGKYMTFVQAASDKASVNILQVLDDQVGQIEEYIYDSITWYHFLNNLYIRLSSYDIQKDTTRYNVASLDDWSTDGKVKDLKITRENLPEFLNKIKQLNLIGIDLDSDLEITDAQLQELNHVITLTLKNKLNFYCSRSDEIVIRGDYVKFSDFITQANGKIQNLCSSGVKLSSVNVFAQNIVFIDVDINALGDGLKLSVIAPEWQIIGERVIILNGASAKAHYPLSAKDGEQAGNKGFDGMAGLPGGTAGSVFGFGERFFNEANLTIYANGGRGGGGQNGGNGRNGHDGMNWGQMLIQFDCTQVKCNSNEIDRQIGEMLPTGSDFVWTFVQITDGHMGCTYKVFGQPGGQGGNGGHGGAGGIGGNPGEILLFGLSNNNQLTVKQSNHVGQSGKSGTGGSGAPNGKNGNDIKVGCKYPSFFRSIKKHVAKMTLNIRSPKNALKGIDGHNVVGQAHPALQVGVRQRQYILNDYKSYLRENLNTTEYRFKRNSLIKFLDRLNSDENVTAIYDTFGLVDDSQGLDRQSALLNKDFLLSSYQILLNRIGKHARSLHVSPNSNGMSQPQKVLSYLYAATLSKISNLKTPSSETSNLIVDVNEYLSLVQKNIEKLELLQNRQNKLEFINLLSEDYSAQIDRKIREAKAIIDTFIMPEIENVGNEIESRIEELISQTRFLQQQSLQNQQDLANLEKNLQRQLMMKSILQVLNLAFAAVSLLGPVGSAIGFAGIVLLQVSENLIGHEQQTQVPLLALPQSVQRDLNSIDRKLINVQFQKTKDLDRKLDEIYQSLNQHPEFSNTAKRITEFKIELINAEKNYDPVQMYEKVEMLDTKSKQEIQAAERQLKARKVVNPKAKFALAKARTVQSVATVGMDLFTKHKDSPEEVDTISSAIRDAKDSFRKLKLYEKSIHTTIAPMLENVRTFLRDYQSKLNTRSRVVLDVTKWKVQSTLKDIKLEIRKLTKGFAVEGDLARCIEKFDEIITTVTNIYDRIQNYQDQQNFAKYLAAINQPTFRALDVTDPVLSSALNKMEISIRSNLVLKHYQSIMSAVKQLVFPYAQFYIENENIILNINIGSDVQTLTDKAIDQIKRITLKVREHQTSIWSIDKYSHSGWFDSDHISTKPFFIWKNSKFEFTILRLLSGHEVVIQADVRMSEQDKDAIKFNLIEFAFKSANPNIQFELDQKLKSFKLEATHLGNSYYRFNGQYYVISSESQTMQYSFEKDVATGVPIHANAVYSKIVAGNLMLSPYAIWRVKLMNLTYTVSFRELSNLFGDKVDLELIGRGSYVERNAIGLNVDDYYKVDDTLDSGNEEIGFSFNSDQPVNRAKRFVENLQTSTSQDTVTFSPVTSSATRASSFVDHIKYFYVKTVDKLFNFQQTFALDSDRIDQNSSTNSNISVRNSLDINGSLLFGQLLVGLLLGKNNSLANQLSYQSPAQEQNVRIDNLSQQILPILKQKEF